jgi:hypothetical protein
MSQVRLLFILLQYIPFQHTTYSYLGLSPSKLLDQINRKLHKSYTQLIIC